MKLRSNSRIPGWALAALLVFASLVSVATPAAAQGGNDTLVIAMQKDIGNYNMFDLATNTVWKAYVVENFYDALAGIDTTGDLYEYLAESWTQISDDPASPDYLKVTVKLRPDVKFSDGRPLTADDVVFSYVALRHGGSTYNSVLVPAFDANDDGKLSKEEMETGVTKKDDRTVQFKLAKKYGQFYKSTLGVPIIPKHIWINHLKNDPACDTCIDTQHSDPAALVGSGPWKFKEGVKDSRYVIERNDLFWGKNFKTPHGKHPVWSQHVRTVQYDIYSSLESAILALRSGKVNHIPWSITPGHIPSLAADPSTKLSFVSENGYFYLAFNEKREPMNDMAFRQAVSHLIDKRTVVDVYMGGFGQAGDSHLPPFWAEWYNSSVVHYDYSLEKAKEVLRGAGYKGAALGNHQSHALLRPDGSVVPPIVLQTPPADYDPVRIKTGEIVAKNMRALGIDATAKAIDFNTLVGRMNGFDYQMIIIGWQLTSDPVGNVCDIMGARATQNYFGFWDPSVPELDNPTYRHIGGVSTKSDAPTRAAVASVAANCKIARESFDPAVQIKAVKDVQGALSLAQPANVLYYRTNAYATSSDWSGWVTHFGKLMNGYSLAAVHRDGGNAPVTAPENILLALNAPHQIPVGEEREVRVSVLKANGLPAGGATLNIRVAGSTVQSLASAGTANADGLYTFSLKGKENGYSTLFVNASLGGRTASMSVPVAGTAGASPLLFVEGKPAKTFLAPGESTTVTYTVRDQNNEPVAGANVVVDQGLLAYGLATTPTPTDDKGRTVLVYSAPTTLPPNRHLEVSLVASGEKPGYAATRGNSLSIPLVVKAPAGHSWDAVSVVSASSWGANAANRDTTVTFAYKDLAGNPLANKPLAVSVSRADAFTSVPSTVTTDANGRATMSLTWTQSTATRAATVWVRDAASTSSLGAAATLLYKGTDGAAIYGGYLSFDRLAADADAGESIRASVKLYDVNGNMPPGELPLAIVVGSTPVGQLANLGAGNAYTYSSGDDAAAIQATTRYDLRSFTTGGAFLGALAANPTGPYGTWADLVDSGYSSVNAASMAPVKAVNGEYSFTIDPAALALADQSAGVTVVPNGVFGHLVTDDERNFYWTLDGDTALGGEYAVWRTDKMIAAHWESSRAVYRTLGDGMSGDVALVAYDQDNQPVEGAKAKLYANGLLPASRWGYGVTNGNNTDAKGAAVSKLVSTPGARHPQGIHNAFGRFDVFTTATKSGYANLIGASHVIVAPVATDLRLEAGEVRVEDRGSEMSLRLAGKDEFGKPLANWTVSLTALKGTLHGLANGTTKLDANGTAVVRYTPPSPSVVPYALDTIKASGTANLHYPAVATANLVVVNTVPRISLSYPTPNLVSKENGFQVTGAVTDEDGLRSLQVRLDDGAFKDVPIATGLTTSGFGYALKDLSVGAHSLTIRAVDQRGFASEETVAFSVAAPPPPPATEKPLVERLTPGPGVLLALAGAALAVVALRRRA